MKVGTILNERYRIEQCLGRGGQGAVYLAHHLLLNNPVALKELLVRPADEGQRESVVRQFTQEARLLCQLSHPVATRCGPAMHSAVFSSSA